MKRRIAFYDSACRQAAVHDAPNWFERWLLRRVETDRIIVAVPAADGGELWIEDGTGQIVKDRTLIDDIKDARFAEWLADRTAWKRA